MKFSIVRNFTLAALLAAPAAGAGQLGDVLSAEGFRWSKLEKLPVVTSQERKGGKVRFLNVIAQEKDLRVELEWITPATATETKERSKRLLAVISSQYGERKTPYPGELTNMSRCGAQSKPIQKEIELKGLGKVSALAAHASDRFAFGACDESTIRQVGLVTQLFHKEASLQVRIFRPLKASTREALFDLLGDLESN